MGVRHISSSEQPLSFLILDQCIQFDCSDAAIRRLLVANFGTLTPAPKGVTPNLHYSIQSGSFCSSIDFIHHGQTVLDTADPGELLYLLEKDVTVELQKLRSDLFFLHSAAIAFRDRVCLLAAEPGSGKSTTTWALLHHEFLYLSDELSPIDLSSMEVFPYPHALCLKQHPPASYPLPIDAIELGRTIHVPTRSLPAATLSGSRPLGAVFLVKYHPELDAPVVRRISPAEASARLYVNTLNALAHGNRGLDAVVQIAEHVPCFTVSSAELRATATMIRSTIGQVIG